MTPQLISLLCVLTFLTGWFICAVVTPPRATSSVAGSAPYPDRPQVIVNVPADYRPLDPLTAEGKPALVGEQALLWYSVFAKAMDVEGDTFWAKAAADEAVRTVYRRST